MEQITQDDLMQMASQHTCGEACWFAKEEICRCSCNGKHHGAALRGVDTGELWRASMDIRADIRRAKRNAKLAARKETRAIWAEIRAKRLARSEVAA